MKSRKQQYLEQLLFSFGDGEAFLGRDAVEGIAVTGGNGSGKTTGSGATICGSFLDAGYGGLYLTSKPDDLATLARDYFGMSGRDPREDIVVIQPEELPPGSVWPEDVLGPPRPCRLNVLEYEYERGGRLTANVVDLLVAATAGTTPHSHRDPFWDEALREMLVHAVDLSVIGCELATGRPHVRLNEILDIIVSAPTSHDAVSSPRFNGGRCGSLIRMADEGRRRLSVPRYQDLQLTAQYWLQQFPGMAEETRSSIVATFTSKVSGLLRSPLRDLFCGDTDDEADPVHTLNARDEHSHPKVLVVNLPVKLYHGVGRFAQCLVKTVWQHAAERRISDINANTVFWRPSFLLADEAQYFITPQDLGFQQTARAAMVATVYLTQNLHNYYAAIGEHATAGFLGTLQTKIFHANGDPTTNEWAQRLFGEAPAPLLSRAVTGRGDASASLSITPRIPAIAFTELLKGGTAANPVQSGRVGAYIFQTGRQWGSDRPDRHYHEFLQGFSSSEVQP